MAVLMKKVKNVELNFAIQPLKNFLKTFPSLIEKESSTKGDRNNIYK